jgi:hypothetical protein
MKPGDYNCKLILSSTYDYRIMQLKGIATEGTKSLNLKMHKFSGQKMS